MRRLTNGIALVFVLGLVGCTAADGAATLRTADVAAHLTGLANKSPEAHDELHAAIDRLEQQDPKSPLGPVEWGTIAGGILGAIFVHNKVRDAKYKPPTA